MLRGLTAIEIHYSRQQASFDTFTFSLADLNLWFAKAEPDYSCDRAFEDNPKNSNASHKLPTNAEQFDIDITHGVSLNRSLSSRGKGHIRHFAPIAPIDR